jgi:hypothetical protein
VRTAAGPTFQELSMKPNEFVERARQGQASPLIYWLGHGGWLAGEAATPAPGRAIDPAAALARLKTERPQRTPPICGV